MNPGSSQIAGNQRPRACCPGPDYTSIRVDVRCTSQLATPPKRLECTPFCFFLAATSAPSIGSHG